MAEDEAVAGDEDSEAEPGEPDADEEQDSPPRRRSSGGRRLGAAAAAEHGLRQIAELTGKEPEGITGVEPGEDGWVIGVEVVEDRRVPSSADILATYEAELDSGGDLVSYRRIRRYPRGRGDQGEGS
ncbi:MAG TPA: gas vesicle protein GvpO [Streptosporangiaceae bacterium]|jgi:hypothetical protein|nr:gas vesicle protein GvpO [Streptosporangiaceae bacterium]